MAHLLTIFTVISEGFCRGSRSFAREQVRRTTDPGLRLSRMTATTNNGFPTTTFGNDDKQKSKKQKQMSSPNPAGRTLAARHSFGMMKKEGILGGLPARSVPESNPCFITTDPGLRLSRMTATTNNRFPTTTFGNDNKDKP